MSETITVPVDVLSRLTQAIERLESRLGGERQTAPDLLTIDDVAARIGRSRRHVERLMKRGKLRKVPDLGRRTTRFRPVDVDKLLAEGEPKIGGRRL